MTPKSPDPNLARAVELLKSGQLVAFPTETVYGLGADATNPEAVARVFAAKGRPATNPLIVHVPDATVARRYVTHWPPFAVLLAQAYWPGPLTLVLPKTQAIAPQVTAGRPSVGLRAPNHPLALSLLKAFDGPIAAPSANRANRVSPTTAEHVREELGDSVDLILDGGPCLVGIESTVLDLTTDPPTLLRPGAITQEQIESLIGPIHILAQTVESRPAPSPGLASVHYAPRARAWRFTSDQTGTILSWKKDRPTDRAAALVLADSPTLSALSSVTGLILMPKTPDDYARRLYSALREADSLAITDIFIELPPDDAQWTAVHDRLRRATRSI